MATLRKDGRWQQQGKGEYRTVFGYGPDAEAAKADLAAKIHILSTASRASRPTTLHDVAKASWYPHIETLKYLTKKRYEGVYVNHIKPALGLLPLAELTVPRVRQWKADLKCSPAQQAYAFDVLRAILMHAETEGLIARNPCRNLRISRRRVKRERVLDLDDAIKLLEDSKATPVAAVVYLAAVLGLSRGEIAGLKWSDIDRRKGEMRIVRQRVAERPGGVYDRPLKRESRERALYLPASFIDELWERGDKDSERVTTFAGRPWIPDEMTRQWKLVRAGLGLPDWNLHDLRHLAAGLLAAAGCDLLVIAAVLGHKRPDMSLVYTSVSKQRTRLGAERLEALLGSRPSTPHAD